MKDRFFGVIASCMECQRELGDTERHVITERLAGYESRSGLGSLRRSGKPALHVAVLTRLSTTHLNHQSQIEPVQGAYDQLLREVIILVNYAIPLLFLLNEPAEALISVDSCRILEGNKQYKRCVRRSTVPVIRTGEVSMEEIFGRST